MRKKLLSILLSVCMVLTLLPTTAFAANTPGTYSDFSVTYDGTAPTFDNGVLTFGTAGEYTVAMANGKDSTSNVIKVTAEGVTLNLDGVVIEAPNGSSTAQDGATALTVTSGTVTLNVMANSSLTGGEGNSNFVAGGNGGAGISGNITVMGTATLTSTGGNGGSSEGGTGGNGGYGISGNVTVTEDATLTATGGAAGTGVPNGGLAGMGIIGNVNVSGTAALIASSGSGMGGMAISNTGGTITVGEDHIVKAGDNTADAADCPPLSHDQLTSLTSLYITVTPPPVLPTAAAYAAASPEAAPDTDYVVGDSDDDDYDGTLTINTAKGAAYWSANSDTYNNYKIFLAANIDVSAFLWTPVGNGAGSPFTGSFDGQGHSISGLTITAANTGYAGLFGGAFGATIQNLCVSGTIEVTETNNSLYIGGIAGWLNDSSTVRNCGSHVEISAAAGDVTAGGIVGWLNSGAIENCFNTGNVSGDATAVMAGGICGAISDSYDNTDIGIVKNSYNTGSVTGSDSENTWLGALGGYVYAGKLVLENCYYLSGTASAAFGYGSDSNGTSFTSGEAGTLLAALNGWVAVEDSADYRTWTADNATSPTNSGYPVFAAVWGAETPIFVNCFGRVKTAKDSNPNAGMDGYGYAFSGWYTAPNGEGTKLGDTDPGSIGTHYYAKWTYNGRTVRTTVLDLRDISESKLYGSGKSGDVYTNAAEGWTWYAAETTVGSETYAANTLVLSGLTLHTAALSVPDGTTVVAAEGTENRVWSGYTSSTDEDAKAYGIYGAGALNIRGGGTLNVLAGSANSVSGYSSSIGIFSKGDLTISDAVTVTARGSLASVGSLASGGGGSRSAGISSDTEIVVSGATVTATSGSADASIGIHCGYDGGTQKAGTIRIIGGTVTATGGMVPDGGMSVGLVSIIKISISGGTVTATGSSAGSNGSSIGMYCSNDDDDAGIVISGGRVAAKSGNAYAPVAVYTQGTLTVGSSDKIAAIANANDGTNAITASSGEITSKMLVMSGTNPVEITFTTYAITASTATHGSYTVKVNGSAAALAQLNDTVTVMTNAASGYELDTISVCKTGDPDTTVMVTNGSFTMPAYAVTVSVTFKATSAPAPSGGTAAPAGAPVIVDGKTQNIGTEKKSGDTTTVTVDQSKLGDNIGAAASGSSVVVPVSENGSATASLMVQNIADMAAKGMTLTVQTGGVAYNLSTAAIDTAALAAAFPGADMSTVPFNVTISSSSVTVADETLVLSPVAFTVTATYGGKTVDVDTFSAYIDRVIEVTKEQAAKITTAVVVNADGSVRHVPTNVIEKDGKYYAVVSSRTNSTYALIQNEVAFDDAEGKWYEAAVNEMGSRKIIAGRNASAFDGDASITRAEFAAILVRALGLPADGISAFADVAPDAWYAGAVATAAQYGIVSGKDDNQFDPNANITRQEAMLMLQRAAALTEFTGASGELDSFADAGSVAAWASGAAEWSVGSGLIQGSGGKLNPAANITRAESATIILRLLQKAGLVDVRSEA